MPPEASTHPTVFVGCPFTPAKRFAEFRRALDLVPLQFVYASSRVRTKHILERIKGDIGAADFSLFDISGWNPNVALELGLADGLGKRYYILFRPGRRRQADAPADLKGLQRFQYTRLRGCAPGPPSAGGRSGPSTNTTAGWWDFSTRPPGASARHARPAHLSPESPAAAQTAGSPWPGCPSRDP